MKKIIILLVAVLCISAGTVVFMPLTGTRETRTTYFTYTAEETNALESLSTSADISLADTYHWDQKIFRFASEHKMNDVEASRLYAYLLVAEHDFASLTFNAKGRFAGSINPMAQAVVCEFFASDCDQLSVSEQSDELSNQTAALVLTKIKTRVAEDKQRETAHVLKSDSDLWQGPDPRTGITAGSRKPWYLSKADQFRSVPPPTITSSDYTTLLTEVKQALESITEQQRQAVVFWAGGPGTKTPPGIWLNIADQYMRKQETPLETALEVRADLAAAMADAVIAVFDSKYTYQQKRPFMLDPSIITVMPTPNHPSYPAGHATISAAAYTVLSHYFPENTNEWNSQAEEASTSRLWGGIHFSIDNDAGFELGKKVGEATIAGIHQ